VTRESLEGLIVRLEPLADGHREELAAAAAASPESFRFFTYDLSRRDLFEMWFERALGGDDLPFTTRLRESGRLVGASWLMTHVPEHRRIEIGNTWVIASAWGSGVNTEAKLLMLEHAFERLGVRRVEFKTEAANGRSRAALAALPAQFEGIHRSHMLVRGGENRDSAWYSVVEEEWPEVRAALRARVQAAASRSSAASSSSGSST
jgi:RimJ/RimL family protein N-acetyltransferase